MFEQKAVRSSLERGNRSSIFTSNVQDRRNLWWKAFRKTVLEPRSIGILENPMTDKVPAEVLNLVEQKCQYLERHEQQALQFVDAVSHGRGFGSSALFPSEILPAVSDNHLARNLEPTFDQQTLPSQEDSFRIPVFEIPNPCPGLVSGFPQTAFDEDEFRELPTHAAASGIISDCSRGRSHPDPAVYTPFLLLERTYGNAKHEIECAMNYCAMNGTAALNSINMVYESAWSDRVARPVRDPVVFSCIIDNDLGIINHHWMSEGGFFVAPLCKFDFRDLEHFMHFLAWIEAIEEWATTCFLPDLQRALRVVCELKAAGYAVGPAKASLSPMSIDKKQDKLSRSMKEAFDNIPWKGERSRRTPLGVTSAMPIPAPPDPKNEELKSSEQEFLAPTDVAPMTKRKKSSLGLSLVKSAGLSKGANSAKETRSIGSAGLEVNESPAVSVWTMPLPQNNSGKSPGIATSTVSMKSPAESTVSIQSKRSFTSLRNRKIKSPSTPDSSFGASPKGSKFKSKISNSLGMIKEHTLTRPKYSDNSAPSSAKDHPPMPTPAYDKKRFDIRTPKPILPENPMSSISETLHNRSMSESVNTSQAFNGSGVMDKSIAAAAYNASHPLPLRQWAKSPTIANTTTTTLEARG
ncbi:hypothetical protein LTR05_002532 [Lithohypha guttulata]|uniref:DUF7924 domain-containing protein n=1 Tax=Lithohypha guttulata TaxID=1690604 RepID=A0AAN7Y850_9EURO|nr:hypothetical protein LTR05_002532 [Lithohypha guttulata]